MDDGGNLDDKKEKPSFSQFRLKRRFFVFKGEVMEMKKSELAVGMLLLTAMFFCRNVFSMEIPERVEYEGVKYNHAKGWELYSSVQEEDITGDGINEVVMMIKTYSDEEISMPASFTLVYMNEGGQYKLKETIFNAAETPGLLEIKDFDKDGVKDLILYEHAGNHYININLYRYRNTRLERVFSSGTACFKYGVKVSDEPTQILMGRENWDDEKFCYANSGETALDEVWIWNGEAFVNLKGGI